jgi:hypothetical protein
VTAVPLAVDSLPAKRSGARIPSGAAIDRLFFNQFDSRPSKPLTIDSGIGKLQLVLYRAE